MAVGAGMQDVVWAIRLPFPTLGESRPSLAALADGTLMGRFRDGETEAFEVLYRRHRAGLHRFVARMAAAEADEIFQEVWMAVIAGKRRYVPSARFVTWLYTIAHHRAVARLRKRGEASFDADQAEGAIDESPTPFDCTLNAELGAALQAAIASLPAAQREAFLMQAEAGMSVDEIAEATGAPHETVKSRLRYAHGRLRTALESWR